VIEKAAPAGRFGTNGVAKTPALPQKPQPCALLNRGGNPFCF
jgi:hypothetical protein